MEDSPSPSPPDSSIDFIPALCFVKRGVAKERPEKVVLTPAELARVIGDTREALQDDGTDDDVDDGTDNEAMDTLPVAANRAANDDEFNFEGYDQEENPQVASIANIAALDDDIQVDDDDDSESEDDIIKPSDNILLIGHVIDNSATMEVWVFNQEEESLYSHHDFLLPSFPLCLEWLSHDPGNDKPGNLCAIGCMDPVITIWDLDIQDSFEPTFKLGSKGSRKKNKPFYGHQDAVLDLAWNTNYSHILASCSVDATVILWDLDEGKTHTTVTTLEDKVQTLAFHPTDAHSLLTGCSAGVVRLFDCRDPDTIDTAFIKWPVSGGEVEKVVWNPNDPNYFMAGTSEGLCHYIDVRHKKPLWSTNGHDGEISGLAFNTEIKNLLTTTGGDGLCKVWRFSDNEIKYVHQHNFKLGRIQCMHQCPEDPFTFAFGGEKAGQRFRIYNIKNFESVRRTFGIPNIE